MKEVVVVARGEVKPGEEEAVERAFMEVIAPTHAEAGCVRYAFHRGVENPRQLMMIERWASQDALQQHLASAHVARLFETILPRLVAPPELAVLEPLSDDTGPKGKL